MTYVATKEDKVRPSHRGARKAELAAKLGADRGTVQWTSAAKGTGITELRAGGEWVGGPDLLLLRGEGQHLG